MNAFGLCLPSGWEGRKRAQKVTTKSIRANTFSVNSKSTNRLYVMSSTTMIEFVGHLLRHCQFTESHFLKNDVCDFFDTLVSQLTMGHRLFVCAFYEQ